MRCLRCGTWASSGSFTLAKAGMICPSTANRLGLPTPPRLTGTTSSRQRATRPMFSTASRIDQSLFSAGHGEPSRCATRCSYSVTDLGEGAAVHDSFKAVVDMYPLAESVDNLAVLLPLGAFAFSGLSIAAWRFFLYSRLQLIAASMLSKYVPRGGARVLQVGGTTRDLYYYPIDTIQVTVVDPKANIGLWQQAGVTAAMPVEVKQSSIDQFIGFQPAASFDAVVVSYSLAASKDLPRLCTEFARVLKSGGAFVFIDRVGGEDVPAGLRGVLGSSKNVVDLNALATAMDGVSAFDSIEVDYPFAGQDPHAIGVARRSSRDIEDDVMEAKRTAAAQKQRKSKMSKGFGQ